MACFHKGDVYDVLPRIPSKSVNLIYCDPPFGTTAQYWDESLDWKRLFKEFFRVLTDKGMIVIHCSIPFNYQLIREAPKLPSHSWYWKKEGQTTPLIANQQPLRIVEEVLVWKNKYNTYYRQQIGDMPRISQTAGTNSYNNKVAPRKPTVLKGLTRTHFLDFKRDTNGYSTRPAEMVKLFINSYSKAGDTILDPFCYHGLSYTQCVDRRWIGIDKHFFPTVLLKNVRTDEPRSETISS